MKIDKNLGFVKKYTYLGITLDYELQLDPFYNTIVKKVNNKIYSLRKVRQYISFKTTVQIYKQTILSYCDYDGFLCVSLNKGKKGD